MENFFLPLLILDSRFFKSFIAESSFFSVNVFYPGSRLIFEIRMKRSEVWHDFKTRQVVGMGRLSCFSNLVE